ncbi:MULTISPECIES: type II toxin-antitoxin system VapC family toxin [unclassified Synechococcus]|uniref:type II toxin-antitoxin system VapC family toxin n=1 Tax=unclassified Synechococcus TaxID=2626047 RepID=UPI0020CC3536|nr:MULTISPECIES: type II toxin-antitoxin system VapC family toxin [unclassified Synechococcus]
MADASAVVAALLHKGPARRLLATATIHAPHLLDVEVMSVFRRLNLAGTLTEVEIESCLNAFQAMGIRRSGHRPLLARIWVLRHNLSAYDATYVSLAEALGCPLLTADRRLAAAPGLECPIQLLPG